MATLRNLNHTIELLALFPKQLEQLFACFSPTEWNWVPSSWEGIPSEKLSAIEQICHVLDIELEGYKVRFERTRAELAPVLPDLPGEKMAMERDYAKSDPAVILRKFANARMETVNSLKQCAPEELFRTAVFEGKQTTLSGLVHFLSSHDYQHLSGLQWLLAKLDSGRCMT